MVWYCKSCNSDLQGQKAVDANLSGKIKNAVIVVLCVQVRAAVDGARICLRVKASSASVLQATVERAAESVSNTLLQHFIIYTDLYFLHFYVISADMHSISVNGPLS
jgi:hypothetical protein